MEGFRSGVIGHAKFERCCHTAEEVLMNGGQVSRLVKIPQSARQQKKTMQSTEEISKIYNKGDLGEEFSSKWCQPRQCKVKTEGS